MSKYQNINKFFGDSSIPFPAEKIVDHFEFYADNDICVCINKVPIAFSADPIGHCHSSFEFIIPSSPMPCIGIKNSTLIVDAHSLIPINTWQPHGPKDSMSLQSLIALHLDKDFLQNISYHTSSSSDFYFDHAALPCNKELRSIIEYFMREARYKQTGYKFIIESLSTQMAVTLLRNAKYNTSKKVLTNKLHESKNMNKVIEFLREHYNSNDYSTEDIARLANLSAYHFIRVFKQQTGQTPYEYLMDIKLEKAKEMLKSKNYTIIEICFSCGFTNHSHFTTTFKKRVGVTPSEYRMNCI
jgi:AraC family transcriptional regulator